MKIEARKKQVSLLVEGILVKIYFYI